MNLIKYQVDAFTNNVFSGNPAAVIPLNYWLDDKLMQNIAMENNLSETAFFVKKDDHFHIRWFTPKSEVDLCGHATLASAFVIFNFIEKYEEIKFESRSGELFVSYFNDKFTLNFPPRDPKLIEKEQEDLIQLFPIKPIEILFDKSFLLVFENEDQILNMNFDIRKLLNFNTHGLIITARGNEVDFVSRFFAPDVGIDEDPVTGYAHTMLTPYWSKKLGKMKMTAEQVSKRGGKLICEFKDYRVYISGNAVLYSKSEIYI